MYVVEEIVRREVVALKNQNNLKGACAALDPDQFSIACGLHIMNAQGPEVIEHAQAVLGAELTSLVLDDCVDDDGVFSLSRIGKSVIEDVKSVVTCEATLHGLEMLDQCACRDPSREAEVKEAYDFFIGEDLPEHLSAFARATSGNVLISSTRVWLQTLGFDKGSQKDV